MTRLALDDYPSAKMSEEGDGVVQTTVTAASIATVFWGAIRPFEVAVRETMGDYVRGAADAELVVGVLRTFFWSVGVRPPSQGAIETSATLKQ